MKLPEVDPRKMADAIREVGPGWAVIILLIIVLAAGFGGAFYTTIVYIVPAVNGFTTALNRGTSQSEKTDESMKHAVDKLDQYINLQIQYNDRINDFSDKITDQHRQFADALQAMMLNQARPDYRTRANDANDRSDLWKANKRLQERVDELNKELERKK